MAIRALRPRPHAAIVENHRGPGTLLVRYLGALSDQQMARTKDELAGILPMHVHVDVEAAPTTHDLEGLASSVVADDEGAADVLLDALLECGLLEESTAPAGVDQKSARDVLRSAAVAWAHAAFGRQAPRRQVIAIDGVLLDATAIAWSLDPGLRSVSVGGAFAGIARPSGATISIEFTTSDVPKGLAGDFELVGTGPREVVLMDGTSHLIARCFVELHEYGYQPNRSLHRWRLRGDVTSRGEF